MADLKYKRITLGTLVTVTVKGKTNTTTFPLKVKKNGCKWIINS